MATHRAFNELILRMKCTPILHSLLFSQACDRPVRDSSNGSSLEVTHLAIEFAFNHSYLVVAMFWVVVGQYM